MKEKTGFFTVRTMASIAAAAAVICIISPFAIPTPGGIPVTLATFAVYITGMLLGKRSGTLAVIIYLLLGLVGLPVFSGFGGGLAKVLGVTGGYLIGYIPCVFITALFADKQPNKIWAMPVGAVLGTIACYAFGTIWYMISTGSELFPALALCVLPYLPFDGIKIAAATAIAYPLRKRLKRFTANS